MLVEQQQFVGLVPCPLNLNIGWAIQCVIHHPSAPTKKVAINGNAVSMMMDRTA